MDQLKTFLAQVKKYHFWILCVIVVVVGLTSWYLATNTLDAQAKIQADKIKAADSKVKQVSQVQQHPNADFEKGMSVIIMDHARSVGKGWEFRYKQQEKLLLWPTRLGREFHRYAEPLRPIEQYVTFDEKDGYVQSQELIPVRFREQYRNFITDELPALAELIQAKWNAKAGEGSGSSTVGGKSSGKTTSVYAKSSSKTTNSGRPGGTAEEEVDDSVVFWSESNQQDILAIHFPFASENATPHTLDVLYAQEDLWVLTAIINVIKRTNGDADANYNAPIKEIQSIEMGRTVRGRMGKVSELEGTTGSATNPALSVPGAMPTTGTATTTGSPTASPTTASTTGTGTSNLPLDPALDRYVDIDYNPLPPKKLRDARTSTAPELAIYSVAKRMPVRIRVVMDQRKLNTLLAECGNSSLPIEVRQVRINCEAGLVSDNFVGGTSGIAVTSSSSSSSSSRPQRGSAGGTSGGSRTGLLNSNSQQAEPDPNEIEVEVYGIVHLYNPENKKQLNDVDWVDEPAAPTAVAPAVAPPRG